MAKTKAKTKKPAKTRKGDLGLYKATIRVFGKEYMASGDSVRDAITKLEPGKGGGTSVLTIEKDGVSREKIIGGRQTARLFNTRGLVRDILLKQISSMFGQL